MRVLAVVILVLGLSGCAVTGPAPGDDPAQVELEGRVTAVMAGSGDDAYVLEVTGKGLLPLDLGGERPPAGVSGVIVEVPDGVQIPDDAAGRFDALAAWVADSGESLVVVEFLTP